MSNIFLHVPALLHRAQRRFRQSRSGSVLILCVALLVLLALIGTAMISAARTDRYSSVQNTSNVELDLLTEGMKNAAKSAIIGDLFGPSIGSVPGAYRPALNGYVAGDTNPYDHWDMPEISGISDPASKSARIQNSSAAPSGTIPPQADYWLSPRYPELNGLRPVWRMLAPPLVGATDLSASGGTHTFDSPIGGTLPYNWANPAGTSAALPFFPTFIDRPDGSAGAPYPALQMSGGGTFLAGDSDGDGIADCGLKRIPSIEGFRPGAAGNDLTFYVGFRIIDNNAAINVNTAWSRQYDFGPSPSGAPTYTVGTAPSVQTSGLATSGGNVADSQGYFRTNVGLLELLNSYAAVTRTSLEMDQLNRYRWSGTCVGTLSAASASLFPAADSTTYTFRYANLSDAMEMALNRRLDAPDKNVVGPPDINYTALGLSDQAALAARFCVASSSASVSTVELLLSQSLINAGGRKPYTPADLASGTTTVSGWFDQNFNFDLAQNVRHLRSALVMRNPVSNHVPVVTSPTLPPLATSRIVPLIPRPPNVPPPHAFPSLPAVPSPGFAGMQPYDLTGQGSLITSYNVTKTDINIAGFPELWRAFWSVMADNVDTTQPPAVGPAALPTGGMFRPQAIRNINNPTIITPSMMLQLRSAIAAVNALDLRDNDDQSIEVTPGRFVSLPGEVTSQEVPLYNIAPGATALPATPTHTARVFGSEKQPFITEVYVNTDVNANGSGSINPSGYVAIELHNPYNRDIALNRWAIGLIARPTPPAGRRQVTELTRGTTYGVIPPNLALPNGYGTQFAFIGGGVGASAGGSVPAVVIPRNGYIVLENYSPTPSGNDATYRPTEALSVQQDYAVYVPNLHEVIGNEAVLLRPRRAVRGFDGNGLTFDATDPGTQPQGSNLSAYTSSVPTPLTDPNAVYNEGAVDAPFLQDFVPIDSYDFTNLTPPAAATPKIWHYVRANDGTVPTARWKFVHPGPYDPILAGVPRAISSDPPIEWIPPAPQPSPPATAVALTFPDGAASNAGLIPLYPGIQIANYDWSPTYNSNVYPFGSAFARNGDVLQTTFMGAYQIRDYTDADQLGAPSTVRPITYFMEFNPITMDAAFIDDQDVSNDAFEQLGRFCPLRVDAERDGDYNLASGPYGPTGQWRYRFAERLFDYLTVQAPASDQKPQRDPVFYTPPNKSAVKNGNTYSDAANGNAEKTVGVDGLININTAPWWILASLPLLPNDVAVAGGDAPPVNGFPDNIETIARQIVLWRDGDGTTANPPRGPFRSIMDLNRVTILGTTKFEDAYAFPGLTADVPGDFEQKFMMFNRLSNLITTRSDSYTVYIVIQGWRNAGAPVTGPTVPPAKAPQLVVQRRSAFIIDRSNITGASGVAEPRITPVPTE